MCTIVHDTQSCVQSASHMYIVLPWLVVGVAIVTHVSQWLVVGVTIVTHVLQWLVVGVTIVTHVL